MPTLAESGPMIRGTDRLTQREQRVVSHFIRRMSGPPWPPLLRAVLFGSKARGDDDADSDIDVLLLFDSDVESRRELGRLAAANAAELARRTGVLLEPWAVPLADLTRGARTPMLVDAFADGLTLWPLHARSLRLPFTLADARFCASRLLEWVEEGGTLVEAALADGRLAFAAERARDDIVRLAAAALLLEGDTRHRRTGTLRRFERRFVAPRRVPAANAVALAWAAAAFPRDGGRGRQRPPPTRHAVRSARLGYELATRLQDDLAPWFAFSLEEA